MRALTLTQPYAGVVAAGLKLVENRPRPIIKREHFGTPFALHASREIDEDVYDTIKEIVGVSDGPTEANRMFQGWGDPDQDGWQWWYRLTRITSAVIAVATVDRAVREWRGRVVDADVIGLDPEPGLGDQRRWFFGPIGYVLRDIRVLKNPVPCRGWQGFWTLTPELESAVLAQL